VGDQSGGNYLVKKLSSFGNALRVNWLGGIFARMAPSSGLEGWGGGRGLGEIHCGEQAEY